MARSKKGDAKTKESGERVATDGQLACAGRSGW